ncbi:MAG: hypothetical protein MK110_14570 [Fuerstiella sp.]|nr:hypothetical protein [Fuerstiella sp.]
MTSRSLLTSADTFNRRHRCMPSHTGVIVSCLSGRVGRQRVENRQHLMCFLNGRSSGCRENGSVSPHVNGLEQSGTPFVDTDVC